MRKLSAVYLLIFIFSIGIGIAHAQTIKFNFIVNSAVCASSNTVNIDVDADTYVPNVLLEVVQNGTLTVSQIRNHSGIVGWDSGSRTLDGTQTYTKTVTVYNGTTVGSGIADQSSYTLNCTDRADGANALITVCHLGETCSVYNEETPPTITSTASATITAGVGFNHTFTATGDPAPTFSYTDETLPPGVTRTGDTLSGTPTTPGNYSITATASNGVAPNAVQVFEITITGDAPVITSAPAGYAEQHTAFSHTFTATGNPAPTLTYSDENLPPGTTRNGDTISGTPTINGEFAITVTASNGVMPDAVQVFVLSVGGLPVPPPTPLCEDHNFSESGVVRSSTADAFGHALNCRVLYQNGAPTQWLGGDLYNGGSIGVEGIFDLGVETAIDIFSPSGVNNFEGGAVFCLKGSGYLIWLAANGQPRHAEIIGSYPVPEFPGFTCATLFEPGTLVLVTQNPVR